MDERAAKRRRTSASPSADGPAQRHTPRRASYMSPTKASLARFNPGLLKSPHLSKSPVRAPASASRRASFAAADAAASDEDTDNDPTGESHPQAIESVGGAARLVEDVFDGLELDQRNAPDSTTGTGEAAPASGEEVTQPAQVQHEETNHVEDRAAKEREKARLQKELSTLKGSCRQLEQLLGSVYSGDGLDVAAARKLATLLDEADGEQSKRDGGPPITALLDSLLPFSNPVNFGTEDSDEEFDAPSHRPLELKDPLPCLQLFSDMRCSLETGLPRTGRDGEGGVVTLQEQSLWLRSAGRQFASRIDFEVSTSADEDTAPELTKLAVGELSDWARPELQAWVKERERDRDLGCLTYGIGEYCEMSARRANVWRKCEQRYARLCGQAPGEEGNGVVAVDTSTVAGTAALLAQLGRRSLSLRDKEVSLRIEWAVQLDWTGAARSVVTASAAFARPYTDLDDRRSLPKVPATFERLVSDRGVFAAIEAMASVLFS